MNDSLLDRKWGDLLAIVSYHVWYYISVPFEYYIVLIFLLCLHLSMLLIHQTQYFIIWQLGWYLKKIWCVFNINKIFWSHTFAVLNNFFLYWGCCYNKKIRNLTIVSKHVHLLQLYLWVMLSLQICNHLFAKAI